jgi:hypothetical protein
MNLDVSIRFSDPKVASEIADAKIADGIKIQRKLTLREMVNPPIDFIISMSNGNTGDISTVVGVRIPPGSLQHCFGARALFSVLCSEVEFLHRKGSKA